MAIMCEFDIQTCGGILFVFVWNDVYGFLHSIHNIFLNSTETYNFNTCVNIIALPLIGQAGNWNSCAFQVKSDFVYSLFSWFLYNDIYLVNLWSLLYYAYIHSTLTYMIPIWGTSPKYTIKILQTLQNKI